MPRVSVEVSPVRRWCGADGAPLSDRLAVLEEWRADVLARAAAAEPGSPLRLDVVAEPVDLTDLDALTEPARSYAAALVERHDLGDPAVAAGVEAAVAAVARGTDADLALSLDDAITLRDATAAVLDRVLAAGVEVRGPRDALLWPLPAIDGRVPLAVAAEAAAAVLAVRQNRPDRGGVR